MNYMESNLVENTESMKRVIDWVMKQGYTFDEATRLVELAILRDINMRQ
ncbi:hypothetical protein LJC20_02565 [Eubacteriales bacterium OttesenSCG-928-M02]|nr:hypothetical protein [Eubacteriales bacterium OttesenSCG-928-M02]